MRDAHALFHELSEFHLEADITYQNVKQLLGGSSQCGGSIPGSEWASLSRSDRYSIQECPMVFNDKQSNLTWLQRETGLDSELSNGILVNVIANTPLIVLGTRRRLKPPDDRGSRPDRSRPFDFEGSCSTNADDESVMISSESFLLSSSLHQNQPTSVSPKELTRTAARVWRRFGHPVPLLVELARERDHACDVGLEEFWNNFQKSLTRASRVWGRLLPVAI